MVRQYGRDRVIDGLYQVKTKYLCAGFVIRRGKLAQYAPILRSNFYYWYMIAERVSS